MGALTAIFPWWGRLLVVFGIIVAIFGIGYSHGITHEGEKKDLVIAKMQQAYDERIGAANVALIAANARAQAATQRGIDGMSESNKRNQRRIDELQQRSRADLASLLARRGGVRVDASCLANAGSRSQLPGTAASPGGPDAAPGARLSEDAIRRLSADADRYTALEVKYRRALEVIANDQATCGRGVVQQPVIPGPVDEVAKKRSIFGLGRPDPFSRN